MVKMTKTRYFKGTIVFNESNRVEKYTPQIYHMTFNFHVTNPRYEIINQRINWSTINLDENPKNR